MSVHTRSQKLAQAAYKQVTAHGRPKGEYVTFAKKFPALVHTCGIAQAVAFALAKEQTLYIEDLAKVLKAGGYDAIDSAMKLAETTRSERLGGYIRLSRDAINAANWLKRHVEAAGEDD